jgi:hypothetical protein
MPTPDPLTNWPWWRDLGERLGRQALQTALPILAAVVAAQGRIAVAATLVVLGGALAVTLAKGFLYELAGVSAPTGAGLVVTLLDRAVPAFAGVLLGFMPADWFGLLAMHWQDAFTAALSAAVVAVVSAYVTPPAAPLQRSLVAARTMPRRAV